MTRVRTHASTLKLCTIAAIAAIVVSMMPIASVAAPNDGDVLINNAQLRADGIAALRASVSVTVDGEDAGPPGAPTNIVPSCEAEPGCQTTFVYENAAGADIAQLEVIDEDQESGHELTVDDSRFEIVGGLLKLVDGVSLDFEETSEVLVTISATDDDGNTFSKLLQIPVRDVNERPFDLALDSTFVSPDEPGRRIGELGVSDPDADDTHTFEVLGDDRFVIVDGVLFLDEATSLPPESEVPVTILATDAGGLTTRNVFVISTRAPGPSPSTVTLLAPDDVGNTIDVAPAACEAAEPAEPGFVDGGFRDVPASGAIRLGPVDAYATGDPIYIRVDDADQNLDPEAIDSVNVRVTSSGTNDEETVVLHETAVDSGIFVSYVFSTSQQSSLVDCILSVESRAEVTATYTDPDDGSDTASESALISPVGVVFNDETGEPLDGVILTLVNVDDGEPANVRGDGPEYSLYPSAVVSGETVKDRSGAVYDHESGEYRFPAIPAGRYRLEIFNTHRFEFSTRSDEELQVVAPAAARSLGGSGRFALGPASRGETFRVSQGAIPRIDVPVHVKAEPADEPSDSTIEFLQYSPRPDAGQTYNVQQAICVAGQAREISELRDQSVPVPGLVNLVETDVIKAGQPLFVRVTDADQNRDPAVREGITIELLVDATDDREFLDLTETEPDSGVFIGYIQSVETSTEVGSCTLSVKKTETIMTRYTDAFDNTDTAESRVLVDPFGVVFSTRDGERINDVTVTLVDAETGEPADVFGDGPNFADYPNPVTTGSTVMDDAGVVYEFPEGGYRFPFVEPGDYRLVVTEVPSNLQFPSVAENSFIQELPGAPYAIRSGSRGDEFNVPVGPAINIDLPVDQPAANVFVAKTASKQVAAIGDFVQYQISIDNDNVGPVGNLTVIDTLPKGFRYQRGSMKVDDQLVQPTIGAAGRTLSFELPDTGSESVDIFYVTEITPGASPGEAINAVTVEGDLVASSNRAEARVVVTEELFRQNAILTGRVTLGSCDEAGAGDVEGVPGVRIYLEDGTFVTTDESGLWHIEGVEPGTRVVQLDTASLEERYEPSPCNDNSRFAGSPHSQFVDVQGGTVWRADFAIQQKPPPTADVELKQSVSLDDDRLWVLMTTSVDGDVVPEDARVLYNAPKGWKLVDDTAELDGEPVSRKKTIVGSLWNLGDLDHERELRFALEPEAPASAPNRMDVLQHRFATRSTDLDEADQRALDVLVERWQGKGWAELTIVGHSDNVPIAPENQHEFSDNVALSRARAQTVADYLTQRIDIPVINVVGAADRYPVASNESAEGRRQNRRVEFLLRAREDGTAVTAEDLVGESSVRLAFSSPGSPEAKSETNKLPLEQLASGFQGVTAKVVTQAVGSWDRPAADDANEIERRDPNIQGLISVTDGKRLSKRIIAIRLDLDSRLKPKLFRDGEEISSDRIGFVQEDLETGKTLYSYIGVDLGKAGTHELTLKGVDSFGNARYEETVEYVRTGELFAVDVVDTGGNVADGTSPVRIELDLRDRAGEQIRSSQTLLLESESLTGYDRDKSLTELSKIQDARYVEVNQDGELLMNPVSVSGLYRGVLKFEEREVDFEVFVEPEKREWIMVGLAEGSVGYNRLSGNMEALDEAGIEDAVSTDGRLAFYAKGQVKGEYILTLAYDSDKEERDALRQQIDPDRYYTLYGDQTQQQYDAESNEKLYLKLERGQFYALFGDYSTGLSGRELTNYSRSLTGLKSEFEDDRFEVAAFVSDADQAFIKDEIRGDGTSGLYRLSSSDIIINSEQVTIETRDRFQSQQIIESERLRRHVDYDIDYDAGTLFFKRPILSQDTAFNPIFIVVDYEVDGDGRSRLNAGGRVAYKFDEDSEIGLTLIHEGVENREASLGGVDLTWQLDEVTELKAEVAASRGKRDSTSDEAEGNSAEGEAFVAEIQRQTSDYDATAYARQIDSRFGVGQQRTAEQGARKVGVEGRYYLGDAVEVRAEAYRQTDLETGAKESVAATALEMRNDRYSVDTGVRSAVNEQGGEEQSSHLVTAGGSYRMLDGRLNLSAAGDAPIGGKGSAANFPKRLRVGLDYQLTESVSIQAEQEFSWGDTLNTQGTRIGMKSEMWQGSEVSTRMERTFDENSERLAAVAGLKQTWQFNDDWRFDFSVDRSQTIAQESRGRAGEGEAPPLQVTTVYASPNSDDFTAVTFGSNFRRDVWDWSTRVEYRTSDSEDRVNLLSDVIHDLDDGEQLLAQVDIQQRETDSAEQSSADIRLGYAFRPVDSRWTLLNRLDLSRDANESAGFDTVTEKIVNNLNANYLWRDGTQIALQYGAKYVVDNFDRDQYSGYTDLLGMEVRHDLGPRWDVGFQGSRYSSWESDVSDYSYGVSVGYNIANNVWMSLGYNFSGFSDEDFTAADYTAEGVYLKYRLKFDQHTMKDVRDRWFDQALAQ